MYCAECLMRYRIASIETTGHEPDMSPAVLAHTAQPAATVIQGTALCLADLVQHVKIQRMSSLVAPDGARLPVPQAIAVPS